MCKKFSRGNHSRASSGVHTFFLIEIGAITRLYLNATKIGYLKKLCDESRKVFLFIIKYLSQILHFL